MTRLAVTQSVRTRATRPSRNVPIGIPKTNRIDSQGNTRSQAGGGGARQPGTRATQKTVCPNGGRTTRSMVRVTGITVRS
ncbi:hypothetical protein Arub01_20920 [Actinomadura rubrobrunea]|uniref:Uncharacterized protein n=1 Tax=Actinomadura rubrobrunea TaxID=115335 RepID=A0A9W6PVU0_9ACTN|nr:hypothetical protein Arub01_20920 [Actinomadura rubrobrunea]